MGGRATTTQKSTTAPAPEAMEYYKDLLQRLKSVQNLAYTPYTGERVAGFTPYQQMAMKSLEELKGAGMGTLQEAVEAGRRGTAPITTADIQRYQNPYETMLVDAMTQQMRQQEAEDISKLQGTSISSGAFGGDRAKMAQAQMMRDQERERNSRIAELKYKGYSDSVAAAQADREAAARGSSLLSQLATQEYNQPRSYINDLYGMGRAQQELEQQRLNIPYQTYLEQRAFPYQQLQYAAGLGTGIGSQMGGTSEGTTTQPKPSVWSQLGGLGLGLAFAPMTGGASLAGAAMGNAFPGFFGPPKNSAAGGRIEKAEGGGLGETAMFQEGFIPKLDPVRGQGAPGFSFPVPAEQKDGASDMIEQAMSLSKKIKGSSDSTNPASWQTTTTLSPENPASWATSVNPVQSMSPMSPSTLFPYSFADGGAVDDDILSADPRMLAAIQAFGADRKPKTGIYQPLASNPPTEEELNQALIEPRLIQAQRAYGVKPKEVVTSAPVVTKETSSDDNIWKSPKVEGIGYTTSDIAKIMNENIAADEAPTQTAETAKLPQIDVSQKQEPSEGISKTYEEEKEGSVKGSSLLGGLLGLSPEAEQALMLAGFSMASGQSPYPLSNIGAGAQSGVKYFNDLMRAKQEQALKEKEIAAKAGQKDMVGTDYVTSDNRVVQRDRNTGKFYDGNMNLLSDDEIKNLRQKRTMSTKVEADLRNAGELLVNTNDLVNSYQPGYGGYVAEYAGDLNNWIATRLGGSEKDKERAAWWQEYAKQAGVIRKSLYGVAFTKAEQALWNKSDINPGMTDDAIQRNLDIQKTIAERAVKRLARSQVKKGYDPDLVAENLGVDIKDMLEGGPGDSMPKEEKEETPKTTEATVPSFLKEAKKNLQKGQTIEQKSNGYWLIDPPNEPKFLGK